MLRTHSAHSRMAVLVILIGGCENQATHIAREAAQRQAEQNTAMADLNREVAGGTRQLVAADAESRNRFVDVHHDLQAERQRRDESWGALEPERKQIAAQRHTESAWIAVGQAAVSCALVASLIGFCWYVVWSATTNTSDPVLSELLIDEVFSLDSASSPQLDQWSQLERLCG